MQDLTKVLEKPKPDQPQDKPAQNTFIKHLKAITYFYETAHVGKIDHSNFIQLQQLQADYTEAYKADADYNCRKYDCINSAWYDLIEIYRQAIAEIDPTYAAANNRRPKK